MMLLKISRRKTCWILTEIVNLSSQEYPILKADILCWKDGRFTINDYLDGETI